MNATELARILVERYVSRHNIVNIEARGQTDPHIRVEFQHTLDQHVRKDITIDAKPFRVRFADIPVAKPSAV